MTTDKLREQVGELIESCGVLTAEATDKQKEILAAKVPSINWDEEKLAGASLTELKLSYNSLLRLHAKASKAA